MPLVPCISASAWRTCTVTFLWCSVVWSVPFFGLVDLKISDCHTRPKGGGSGCGALWDHLLQFPVRLMSTAAKAAGELIQGKKGADLAMAPTAVPASLKVMSRIGRNDQSVAPHPITRNRVGSTSEATSPR